MKATDFDNENPNWVFEILELCPALAWASTEQRIAIASSSVIRQLPEGEVLFRQGDPGEAFYVVVRGELEVVQQRSSDSQELVLARVFNPGEPFGELAAVNTEQKRSATIRAAADSTIIEIPFDLIDQVGGHSRFIDFSQQAAKKHRLHDEIYNTSHLFQILSKAGSVKQWIQEENYSKGDQIFSEGDSSGHVYFIIAGEVEIYRTLEGKKSTFSQISAGQMFGELGAISQSPRSASARAISDSKLTAIAATRLRELAGQSEEFSDNLQVLRNIYMDRTGSVIFRWEELRDGNVIHVVSIAPPDGSQLLIQYASNSLFMDIETDPLPAETKHFCFKDDQRRIQRTVKLHDNHIVAAGIRGPYSETGHLIATIRDNAEITPAQLETFCSAGMLFTEVEATDTICHCMQVTKRQLEDQIKKGCRTVYELTLATEAGAVCGGCLNAIEELTGSFQSHSVRISGREEIAPDAFRIRFEPEEGGVLTSSTPGQHIVVEGCIDGLAVRRPYTLTSDNKERRWREITIQKEAHGLFSHWLATVPPAEAEIKISQPSGTFAADLDDPSPLILMVAGIGVTPAIAIARSRIKKSTGPKIIIDHSARTSKKLVSAVELEDLAAKSGSIFYKFRRTSGGERIKGIDLVGLHQENPDCRWMICGPGRFEAFVESKLIEIGVNPDRIAVEHFRPPEAKTTQPFQPDKSALFIGVLITLLTLIILLFDWVPIGLQKWQATTSGHWISGFALLLFLGAQWWLPKLRWHKPSGSVSKAIHWHRRIGAISPLLLILHGNSIGTGILGLLSMVFFINTIVGLADRSIVSSPKLQLKYLQWWLFPHILLSILFTTLSIYHVWIIIIHGGP